MHGGWTPISSVEDASGPRSMPARSAAAWQSKVVRQRGPVQFRITPVSRLSPDILERAATTENRVKSTDQQTIIDHEQV